MKKRLPSVAALLCRHLSRRGIAAGAILVLLAAGSLHFWLQHRWPERVQQELDSALAASPYRITLTEEPHLRWGWSPYIAVPSAVLTPRHAGSLPPVRLEQTVIRLRWWGSVARFSAARAEIGLPTPVTLRDIRLSHLMQQDGFALTASVGTADRPQSLALQLGTSTAQGRALLLALGSLEAAGVWRATATGGQLDLPRLKLDDATGSGRLTLSGDRIGGVLRFDRLRLSGGSLPFRELLTSLKAHLDPVSVSAGQIEIGGKTFRTVETQIDATTWRLKAGQGPTALRASGEWQADAHGLSLPALTWQSRSLAATGSLQGPSAATPDTSLTLAAKRLDLTVPGGEIDVMRLITWLRSRTAPITVRLDAPTALLPLLPPGTLASELTLADGIMTVRHGSWHAANGDVLNLTGNINIATLFPKLDLHLDGERAARPDRLNIQLTGPATHPELAATLKLQDSQTSITGSFNLLMPTTPFKGRLSMTGPRGNAAQGVLRVEKGILIADAVAATLNGATLSGRLQLDPNGPLPQITADMQTATVTLAQLGALAGLGASGWAATTCPQQQTGLPPFTSSLALHVGQLPLDFGRITQASVFLEGRPGGVQGRLNSPQGQIDLQLPGRPGQAGPEAHLKLALQGLTLARTAVFGQGQLDLAGTLVNAAPCDPDWHQNLRGPLTYRLRQAEMRGMDLKRLSAVLTNRGLGGLLSDAARAAILPTARTALPELSGRGVLGGGVVQLAPVAWRMPGQTSALTGKLNIILETVDLRLVLEQQTPTGLLPITIGIHGPLAQPDIRLQQGRQALGAAVGREVLRRMGE
jgi:hypothetical protein